MPVLRNPFRKSVNAPAFEGKLGLADSPLSPSSNNFQHDRKSPTSSVTSAKYDREPDTYKLCDVNDSGVFIPPSPMVEKPSFWHRSDSASKRREVTREPEVEGGFAISRESFEGYRRSFDISARSPVPSSINSSRQSLDIRPSRGSIDAAYTPRMSLDSRMNSVEDSIHSLQSETVSEAPSEEEEEFQDVNLNENKVQPKKKGFLSRFSGHSDHIPEAGEHKGRSRSSTLTWRKETNKESEELGDITTAQ